MRRFPFCVGMIMLSASCVAAASAWHVSADSSTTQSATATASGSKTAVTIQKKLFGKTSDGKEVNQYICTNAHGCVLKLITYGARVQSLEVPDKKGKLANVTLGFDSIKGYEDHKAFFGCTVGRYANRIAKGKFTLDGKEYTLATNNGPNHLHGGLRGFDRMVWNAEEVKTPEAAGVKFTYRSADEEEGFPGNLDVTVICTLTNNDALKIEYLAKTDKTTIINLTNHSYWNLGGVRSGKVLDHELMIAADKYLPIDKTSIPIGEIASVAGTIMDFTKPQAIGARIGELTKDPEGTKGYDHCYVLRSQDGSLALAARIKDPKSGRVMEISTTEPGVQLYIGNFLDGDPTNGGHQQHDAFCLETQHYPDSPNQPQFPTTVLKPGQTYKQTTVHKFSSE